MKTPSSIFKVLFLFTALLVGITSCTSDDGPRPGCYQEDNRRIVATITDVSGVTSLECLNNYTINPDSTLPNNILEILSPCNLEPSLQEDGLRVIFSGYIYESFEFEDICADFFELTEITVENQ